MVNRGDVVWAASPRGLRRPYLVLTRQAAMAVLHQVLAVPATRTIRDIPTEVVLEETDGMPERCALSLDNVTLLPTTFLGDRITHLGARRMAQVCDALAIATACT